MHDSSPLVVFSDDWGRHPSAPQHIVRRMLAQRQVLWVNTIGTRRPGFNHHDLARGVQKCRQWLGRRSADQQSNNADQPNVINPVMWPSYAGRLQRSVNTRLVASAVRKQIDRHFDRPPVVITTIPMTVDLIGRIPASRWIYYCVDDWSTWPGLDHATLTASERRLIERADAIVAASDRLAEHVAEAGHDATVITHGVDAEMWSDPPPVATHPIVEQIEELPRPHAVFWGMIDTKLSVNALTSLAGRSEGSIILIGPHSDGARELSRIQGVHLFDAVPPDVLPHIASLADALIMPYVTDHPALIASQPLKLKEYLATDRPVTCTDLPSTRAWSDCADVVSVDAFATTVINRLHTATPIEQMHCRHQRIPGETWQAKAAQFEQLLGDSTDPTQLLPEDNEMTCRLTQQRPDELCEPAAHPPKARPVVLHVRTVCGTGGGPDKTIMRSARYADPERYRLAAAYIHPACDDSIRSVWEGAEQNGMELFTIPERGPIDPTTVMRLARLADQLNVSVWHSHDYKSDIIGLLVRMHRRMKLITTVHGRTDETWRTRLYRRLDERCLRYFDRVITVSQDIAERCRKVRVSDEHLSVVHNAIDPSDLAREQQPDAAKLAVNISPRSPVIGIVGRLSIEKGIDRLLASIPEMRRSIPDLRVLIVGDGPERSALEATAREYGVRHAIRFAGWRQPINAWLEAMDILALPSRTEGMPNVVLEAMVMGVPVAATDVGGVDLLIEHDRTGILLDDDEQHWASALTQLLFDPEKRSRLASAARDHVEQHFSFAERTRQMLDVYDSVLRPPSDEPTIDETDHDETEALQERQAA